MISPTNRGETSLWIPLPIRTLRSRLLLVEPEPDSLHWTLPPPCRIIYASLSHPHLAESLLLINPNPPRRTYLRLIKLPPAIEVVSPLSNHFHLVDSSPPEGVSLGSSLVASKLREALSNHYGQTQRLRSKEAMCFFMAPRRQCGEFTITIHVKGIQIILKWFELPSCQRRSHSYSFCPYQEGLDKHKKPDRILDVEAHD